MPEPQTAAHIAGMAGRLRSEMHIEAPLLRTGRMHISLHHLGDFEHMPEVLVARASAAAASIDVRPFPVTFDRILSFNGQAGHWNWVLTGGDGLGQLIDFQQRPGSALRRAGLRVREHASPRTSRCCTANAGWLRDRLNRLRGPYANWS